MRFAIHAAWKRYAFRQGSLCAVFLTATGCLSLATGCSSTGDQYSRFLRPHEQIVASGEYRVAPPDVVTVNAPVAPEIDGVAQQIRPDGKITLRLLGEVHVAGLTTKEAAEKIAVQLSRFYQNPEVVVGVAQYASQYFYVFGEVAAPGPKPYTGRDTLMMALSAAQPNTYAWKSRIRVTRPGAEGDEPATIIFNLDEMVASGDMNQDVLLQPGDIVEVPPTPIAWVGHQVRALLYPVSPVLRAYDTPANFIQSRNTYRDLDDDDDNDGGGLRRLVR